MKSETRLISDVLCCLGLWVLHVNCKTVCTRTSNSSVQLNLTCSTNQMIHVVSELVGRADTSSTSCRVSRTIANCSEYRNGDRTGLGVNCNGHSSCYENASTTTCPGGISDRDVEVEYECIEGSVDICSGHTETDRPVYLHSPGFPGNHKAVSLCTCTVSSLDINIMLLHYNVAWYGDLSIYDKTVGTVWPGDEHYTLAYNREILTHYSGDLTIYYNNKGGLDGSGIWIRITGAKTISCTNQALPSPSTTVQTVTRENTSPSVDKTEHVGDSYDESDNNRQLVVAVACAGVLIVLLITAVSVVSFKCHRYRKGNPDVNLNDDVRDQAQTDFPDRNPVYARMKDECFQGDFTCVLAGARPPEQSSGGDSEVPVDHTGVNVDVDDVSHVYSDLDALDSHGNTDYASIRVNDATTESA